MATWITITLSDLNDARAAKLVEALRTKALAEGQTDPMPRIVTKVATEIRDSIAFGGVAVSATAEALPLGLKDVAVQKIIRVLKSRLLMELTEDERSDETLYQKRLEQLNRGAWPVEPTDDPIATPSIPPASGYFGSAAPVSL